MKLALKPGAPEFQTVQLSTDEIALIHVSLVAYQKSLEDRLLLTTPKPGTVTPVMDAHNDCLGLIERLRPFWLERRLKGGAK